MNTRVNRPDTELDYRKRINQAMFFIQENSSKKLSLEAIAEKANFSVFHFHRIFTAIVGETVGEYINRVRIINAASLIESGLHQKEAALLSGYENQSAFIQIFKKSFGISPGKFKSGISAEYSLKPPSQGKSKKILSFRTEEFPDIRMLYIRKFGSEKEYFNAGYIFERLYLYLEQNKISKTSRLRFGILHGMNLVDTSKWAFDACISIPLEMPHKVSGEVKEGIVKAGKWAIFQHSGPYETLWQTWNLIYKTWAPYHAEILRDANPFEVYLNDKRSTQASELLTEIYIPIV